MSAGACHDRGTPTMEDSPPTSSTALASISSTTDDLLVAEEAGLRPIDLPAGWTQVGSRPKYGNEAYGPDHCLPPSLFSPGSVGVDHIFSFNLEPDGTEGGHLSAIVSVIASASLAADQLAYYNSAAYQPCMVAEVREDLVESGGGIQVFDAQAVPLSLDLPLAGRADRVTIRYRFRDRDLVQFRDVVHLVVGRIKAHFVFTQCCTPVGADLETSAAIFVDERLQAASAKLT